MDDNQSSQITELIQCAADDDKARSRLFRMLNEELRKRAKNLIWDSVDPEVQPTMLVNEVVQNFENKGVLAERDFPNRKAFMGYLCQAMQRVLIDHHRKRKTHQRSDLVGLDALLETKSSWANVDDYEDLHVAIESLRESSPTHYEVVMLRFFGGLTIKQTAAELGVVESTVENRWRLARAKLFRALKHRSASD